MRAAESCAFSSQGWLGQQTALRGLPHGDLPAPRPPSGLLPQVLAEQPLFWSPCLTAEGGDLIFLGHCGFTAFSTGPNTEITLNI